MTTTRPVGDVAAVEVRARTDAPDDQVEPAVDEVPADSPVPTEGAAPGAKPVVALGYTAGFDGLRALGLLLMLAYHSDRPFAEGGIFTVSMFFTLSGYLIATLTLMEWVKHDRISLARFWERRARRLLPAALLTLAGVVVLQYFFEVGSDQSRFRADVLGALGYIANWRMAYSGGDYGRIFRMESPVQHFWSLAVEEQFYVAFPLLFIALMALTRRRWKVVGLVFGLGSLASFVAAWRVAESQGRNGGLAYYATYTRASEILVGVALAFLVVTPPVRRFLASRRGTSAVRVAGLVGVLGLGWLWTHVGLSERFVFRGGTLLNATLTSLVILASISATPGLVARGLGIWPLRNLGKISYGVYLVHWPLFILLDGERTGLESRPNLLFVVRVAASIGVAVAMYHLFESPIRFRLRVSRPMLAGLLVVPTVLLVPLVQTVPVHRGDSVNLGIDLPEDPWSPDVAEPPFGVTPAARVLAVGDSVTWTTWGGYNTWNRNHPDETVFVDSVMAMGCSMADIDEMRHMGDWTETTVPCARLRARIGDALRENDYDAIVVTIGHKDLGAHMIDGEWRSVGDPAFDRWYAGEVGEWIELLASEDVPVLWSTLTHVHIERFEDRSTDWRNFVDADNDPDRVDRINRIMVDTVASSPHGENFQMMDTGGWVAQLPGGEFDPEVRFDGVHFSFAGSDTLADWVVPQILEAKRAHDLHVLAAAQGASPVPAEPAP